MKITMKLLQDIIHDIKNNNSWVNDSHSNAEHRGICSGLNILVLRLEEKMKENIDANKKD